MKVLAKKFDRYTRRVTDIIFLDKDRIYWLRKSWSLDPDCLWQANNAILEGFVASKWEDWVEFLTAKAEKGYGYIAIAKYYGY